jgi:hypothetical protein
MVDIVKLFLESTIDKKINFCICKKLENRVFSLLQLLFEAKKSLSGQH